MKRVKPVGRAYSPGETRTIVAGLPNRPRLGRPMSDTEWRARTDPKSVYEDQLLSRLDRIAEALSESWDRQTRTPEPRLAPVPSPRRKGGAINL